MQKNIVYSIIAVLLMGVTAILFFYPDVIEGNVLMQHDIQQGLANGQEAKAFHEATGETTRWTDSLFGGMPTFQIAPSYPSTGALSWIAKVYTLGLPSPAGLLFSMMLGFFIMCLCMRMRWYYALLGAVGWGLSTYFVIIIGAGHIWKFVTLSYIPPTIGGIWLCYHGRRIAGTALAALFGALQLQSNHPQMSYYFGFVILALMIAWLVSAIRRHEFKAWGVSSLCVVAAGILALAANSSSLYHTYLYSKETIRGRATEITDAPQNRQSASADGGGLSFNDITAWSYGLDETYTLLIPNVKGGASVKPVAGNSTQLGVDASPKAQKLYNEGRLAPEEYMWMAQFPQYFGNQPMTNGPVYVGAILLLLALLALFVVEGPVKWALFGVSVLAILLSWGHNFEWFTRLFIDLMPGYNRFRTVSSILVIVEFTIPLLAILCIKKIASTPDFLKRYEFQTIGVVGIGVLVCLIGWLAPGAFGTPFSIYEREQLSAAGMFGAPELANVLQAIKESRLALVSADSLRSLLFILAGSLVVWLYCKKKLGQSPVYMVCALTLLTAIDLFTVDRRYINSENFTRPAPMEETFDMTPTDRAILADKGNYRVLDTDGFGSARSSFFHKTIGGYHAAKLTRYNDLIEHQISKGNPAVINMLNAKYIIHDGTYSANPDALGNGWFVSKLDYVGTPNEEMRALDSLDTRNAAVADTKFQTTLGKAVQVTPGDTIIQTEYRPNRLTYKTRSAKEGVAVFSEIYFPWGWTATVDGTEVPIGRVNYVLRALRLPVGEHTVVFTFDPKSIHVTEGVSITALVLIYLLCAAAIVLTVIHLRKRKVD